MKKPDVPWYEKPASPAAVSRMITKLRGRWPAAFSNPPQPLMIDISRHIADALHPRDWSLMGYGFFSFSKHGQTLRDAMQQWTRAPEYLAACSRGAARVNLAGEAVGKVSEPDAIFAAIELQRQQNIRRGKLRLV
jgi:sRNA-binding protein